MAGTISLPTNLIAHTPAKWTKSGVIVAAPVDAIVVSSDSMLGTVAFNSDFTSVDTTPDDVATGSFMVTVSSASLSISDAIMVTSAAPSADTVTLDAGATTFTPKP